MANNLLVDWLNKKPNLQKANVQSVVNNNTASNAKNVTAPELKLGGVNLQKAQANVNAGGMVGAGSVAGVNLQNKPTLNTLGPGTKSNIVSNNPAFNNGGLVTQNNPSNRFIGFQQQPTVPNTVMERTPEERQGLNWQGMLNGQYAFVPSEVSRAEAKNAAEENRFRTMSEAFYDLQGDLYNRGKILNDYEIKQKYPEFKSLDMSVLKELQNELLPIVKNGMGVDADQLSQYYPELLKGKELNDIDELKGKIEKGNEWYKGWENALKKVAKGDVEGMSSEGVQSVQDAKTIRQMVQAIKKQGVVGGGSDYEILKALYEKDPEAKKLMDNFNSRELTEKDKAIWGREDASLLREVFHAATDPLRKDDEFMKSDEELTSLTNKAKAMEDDYWGQVGGTARVGLRSTADTWEKFIYRMSQDAKLWTIEDIDEYLKQSKENERNVAEYNASVDRETENVAQNTINQDVRDYYNNHTMSRSLALGDVPGFFLQSTKSATENVDMPIIIAAGVVAPEVVLPLMATDTYVRESEDAFEQLLQNGASYDDAEQGAVVVGVANTIVELWLEKAIGGVETTASKAIRDALMKDISKKTTEMVASRGLTELLKQGAVTQFRSSLEEGLEEIVQQSIQNYSVSKYNPDVKITDGLREAFEGGFFNPMNLLAGGGDIASNIDVDAANQRAYNQGVKTRNAVDNTKNALNQGAYNAGAFLGNMTEDFKNSFTPGGAGNNQGGQQQGTVNTTSENQNNINGQNYNQNTKNNKTLNSVQLGMLQNDNRMNPSKITEFKEKFGLDYGQALADMGYTESQETNVPKIEEDTKDIYNKKKEAMNAIEGEFQDRSLRDMLNIMIKKAKNTLDYEMLDKYQALKQKHNSKGLTMAEANDMREEFSYKVKTKWGGDGNSDKIDLANNVYSAVKNFLEKKAEEGGMKDLKQINRDIAMRKYLSTWIGDKADKQSANNMVSLTDRVILAEAVSNPYAAAGFAAKKLAQKPRVKNAVLNAVVGRRENRTIDTQNRNAAAQERMQNIENANKGKELQQELAKPATPALPNGIKLTKVTEVDARKNNKPKNTVTKKSKSENNKKSDSSSNDDTNPPSGGTPTGNGPTNTNPKGTTPTNNGKNNVTQEKKSEPKKETKAQPKQDKQEAKRQANVDTIKKYADEYGIERDEELAKNAPTMHGDLIKEFLTKTEGPITFEKHGDGEVAAALDTNLYKKNPQNLSNTFYVGGNKADMDFLRKINRPETENTKAYAKLFEVKEEPENVVTKKSKVTEKKQETNESAKERAIAERQRLDEGGVKPVKSLPKGHQWNEEGAFSVTTPGGKKLTFLPVGDDLYIKNWQQVWTKDINNTVIEDYKRFSANELTNFLNGDLEGIDGDFGGAFVTEAWHKLGLPLGFTQNVLRPLNPAQRNVVTDKAKATEKKTETKPVENSELRDKIGDSYYNYLEKQLDIVNKSREANGETPLKIEELNLTSDYYRNGFYKVAQQELDKIQKDMAELMKDFPEAPALTDAQRKQLSGITSQAERNKLLKKWQDEWLKENEFSVTEEQLAELEKISGRAAKNIDEYNQAMNYLNDLEVQKENQENEDRYSEESKTKVTEKKQTKEEAIKWYKDQIMKGEEISEDILNTVPELKDAYEARKRGLAKPDGVLIYTNSEFKYIPSVKEGLIRLTREEGKAKFKKQMESALENGFLFSILKDIDTGETYILNPHRTEVDEYWNNKPDEVIREETFNGDNIVSYDIENGDIMLEREDGNHRHIEELDLKDFLNNTYLSDYVSGTENTGTKTGKNKITNTKQTEADTFEDIDNETLKILIDKGDKAAIALYEDMTAEDQALVDMYAEEIENDLGDNETPQMPTIFEEDLEQMNLRELEDNETPQRVDIDEGVDISTQLVDEFNNLEVGGTKWVGDGYNVGVRKTFGDASIKIPGEEDSIDVMFMPKDSGDTMHINLHDTSNMGIRNTNEVLSKLDIPYKIGSEFDEKLNETRYFLENKLTHSKTYFENNGTSWLNVNKQLRGKEIVPRMNAEQRAAYEEAAAKRQAEIEAEREEARKKEEERKAEEARQLEEENKRKANLIEYVDAVYGDDKLQRGRILKALGEKNEESKNGIKFYDDDKFENADVWEVLDYLATKNGKFHETWEYGDTYSNTYEFFNNELGRNENIHHITKTQKDYLEYRMNNQSSQDKTTTEVTGEKNAVTAKQVENEKPKNLVTSKVEENSNTDNKADQIFNTSMEQLKGAKKVSLGALGKVKQTEVKLDNGTTITYIDSSVGKGISQNAIIRINSPEAGYKTYVVTKIGNNVAEIREGGNVLSDEQVNKLYDIMNGKNGNVEVKDMKVEKSDVEDKNDPINAFLDNNEEVKKNPSKKYEYLSKLNEDTTWIDYSTDIKYHGTVAEKVQQTIDSFGKLSNGVQLPIRFTKNNYGNYIEVGDWETGLASRDIGDDIEFEYAKFLYDNKDIRAKKDIKAEGLKEAIKKGNEIHKEVVKDIEENAGGIALDPEKYIWQQPTAEQGIDAVYEQVKKISDFYQAQKDMKEQVHSYEEERNWKNVDGKTYPEIRKAASNAVWSQLQFKSDRSKLYQDLMKNVKEANGNEKQLRSIANNLYIQKVKDDFKQNYNYPSEVTDKVPGLRTAKDNYERYLKGKDTSFSGKDPRIDYSDKDLIGAGVKRQDGNQITAEQRREITNGVLEYAKIMGIDMKKMGEDIGLTYVHLNGKHPFLRKSAIGLFRSSTKSISIGADVESYSEKGEGRDAKLETHTAPVVMAHEITHAIDGMFERDLFSEMKTREMGRKMNDGRRLGEYRHRKAEITARMVEEYVDVMKGGEGYYTTPGYWSKDIFENEIKPYVEQIFDEKFEGYRLSKQARDDIKLVEPPKSNNSVTASNLNKVTNNAARSYSPTIVVRFDENGNPLSNSRNRVTTRGANRLQDNGMTQGTTLSKEELREMKNRNYSILKTHERSTNEDTLSNIKQEIKSDLGDEIIDGYRMPRAEITHTYNSHAYDTELGYGRSITEDDFEKIPDILKDYDNIQNTTDDNGNPTGAYLLTKNYGGETYNLVVNVITLRNGKKQLSHKTFYINDAAGRRKFYRDKNNGVDIRAARRQAKRQYGDRFNS